VIRWLLLVGLALLAAAFVPGSSRAADPSCAVADQVVPEGDNGVHWAEFQATCSGPLTASIVYTVTTQDGTAVTPDDYQPPDPTAGARAGDTALPFVVGIVGDTVQEGDETFTVTLADPSGTVTFSRATATITIADDDAPATGPCLLISDNSVSVSADASTPDRPQIANPQTHLTMENCGTAPVNVLARGTDATGAPGSWTLTDVSSGGATDSTCDLGPDLFRSNVTLFAADGSGVGTPLVKSDRSLLGLDGLTPFVLDASATQEWEPQIDMPCVGSAAVGTGDAMSMDITVTAVAPS